MDDALPGGKEASYRLLGLQALVHDGGVILKRGTTRLFLDGDDVAELVDLVVARLAGGRAVALSRLLGEVGAARRDALVKLIEVLKAHRFLADADDESDGGHNHEEVFFWNYQATFAEIVGELAEMHLTVFGVNAIGLALLGNLRGCGFRNMTFVDHPALRNVDYFDSRQQLRSEISGVLSVPPVAFDHWASANVEPDGCMVVCCDFGGRPLMRDWNRYCVEKDVLFYPIVLLDHVAQIGPLVRPGDGPCYECLWARRDANMADPSLVRAGEVEPDSGHQAIGYLQPMARAAADFAAIDLLKTFSRSFSGNPIGRILEIDLLEPRLTARDLLRVPACPVCSPQQAPGVSIESQEAAGTAPAANETETETEAAVSKERTEPGEAESAPENAAEGVG
jgi:bacteriocin biosynthesis cyclodehydratase domain-containing protein